MPRLLAILAVSVALAGCTRSGDAAIGSRPSTVPSSTTAVPSSTVAPASTTTSAAGPAACASADLALDVGEGRAALGRGLSVFELRNASGTACRMTGNPSVTLVGPGGRTLSDASSGTGRILPNRPALPVVLAPEASAYFGVEAATVCAEGARPAASVSVRVVPPGQAGGAALSVDAAIPVCAGQTVVVSPVRATEDELTR